MRSQYVRIVSPVSQVCTEEFHPLDYQILTSLNNKSASSQNIHVSITCASAGSYIASFEDILLVL